MDKEVHINILPYLPQISEATILGEVFFSDYKGVLLSDITSVQEAQYHHILSVFKMINYFKILT